MCCRVFSEQGMNVQSFHHQMGLFPFASRTIFVTTMYVPTAQKPWTYVSIFLCISSETPSFPHVSVPPIQFNPVVFWKGGYIHCYCMILQNLSSQPLKQWRADRSPVIPAVSLTLGKTWVSPTTRTLLSFFISIRILPAPSCNWKKFMSAQQIFRALWRYASGCEAVQVDLRVFVLVEVFENKQEDREA